MNWTNRDTSSNLPAEGSEALFLDHLRKIFRADERKLELVGKSMEQVRQDAENAKSKVQCHADSRLEKLQACLDRVNAAHDTVTAEIRTLEEDRQNLRNFIGRANGGHWSEAERAMALSNADTALSDLAQSILQGRRQIEDYLKGRDLNFQDAQSSAERKNACEELLSLLQAGGCPGRVANVVEIAEQRAPSM